MLCISNCILQCDAAEAKVVLLRLHWLEHELLITTPTSSVTSEFLAGVLEFAAANNEELMKYAKAQKNYHPGMPVTEALTAAILWEGSLTTLDSLAADLVIADITRRYDSSISIFPSDGKISRDKRIVPTGTPSICH
eukprot:GHVU01073584.1.p1 GENE.GHVU01073584.1~~GHVU01073584.1.p1  ORF type:complete len:137 (-),score=10.60 GHVU01073584.1:668-1078(-)